MSRPAIPARVARLLPLLASPIDGEALNACRALVKAVASEGLDLRDLAAELTASGRSPVTAPQHAAPGFFDMSRACRDFDQGRLSPRERAFVNEMVKLGARPPTPPQARWLGAIFARLRDRSAA